jgi:hypothetical protein
MASQYLHLVTFKQEQKQRPLFGTTIHPIVYESGRFPSGRSWWQIKQIKPEIQFDQYTQNELLEFLEYQVNEKIDQLYEEYQDYSNFNIMCSKNKKSSKKITCVVDLDDGTDVLPVVLPLHSIVIQDYTKPSNGLGYKVPIKEPSAEDKKKAFKKVKNKRNCSRKRERDIKQEEASQRFLMD